jgi:hypothetical protein
MRDNLPNPARRHFLSQTLSYGLLGIGMPGIIRNAFAMGSADYPQGMRKIEGQVSINGTAARLGATVNAGDIVSTGAASLAIFVIAKEVYMLRENTRLELVGQSSEKFKESAINVLRLLNGKMMAVFRKSPKQLEMPTVIAGVRGTGLYAEVEPERAYLCICYGAAEIQAKADADVREKIHSQHHDMPRYIYAAGNRSKLIEKAGGHSGRPNHTDEELILLESYVGRKPIFFVEQNEGGGGGGGGGGY